MECSRITTYKQIYVSFLITENVDKKHAPGVLSTLEAFRFKFLGWGSRCSYTCKIHIHDYKKCGGSVPAKNLKMLFMCEFKRKLVVVD